MNHIRACFNKAANTYDNNSGLQTIIGNKLIKMLIPHTKSSLQLIDLGCAAGKLTMELARHISHHFFMAIDIAENLLALAKSRLTPLSIKVLQADFANIPLKDHCIDLVFSNMALHWNIDNTAIIKEPARILTPGGILAFSVPIKGTFIELINCQQHINNTSYDDRFTATSELIQQLKSSDFNIIDLKINNYIIYFKNILHLIKSLKNSGTNYVKNLNSTLKTKSYLNQLEQYYFAKFGHTNHLLPLTYSILSVIAQKGN